MLIMQYLAGVRHADSKQNTSCIASIYCAYIIYIYLVHTFCPQITYHTDARLLNKLLSASLKL